MKKKGIVLIGFIMIMTSCSLFNANLRYEPKSSEDFYFPSLSDEFKKNKADCIAKKEFPCDIPEPNDTLSDFVNNWYSKHLKSLKEPILHRNEYSEMQIIRFTHLGTWLNPFSCRIENNKGIIIGTYNKTKGLGGYNAGRRIKHVQKNVTQDEWNQIINKIDNVNFWNIKTHDDSLFLDGEEWILEVTIEGKYHFVTRNSPDSHGDYAQLCAFIIKTFKK